MNKRSNPVAAFLRGKGFYLVMTVCILTAAGCSFAAIRNMMDELEQNASSAPQTGEGKRPKTCRCLPLLPRLPHRSRHRRLPPPRSLRRNLPLPLLPAPASLPRRPRPPLRGRCLGRPCRPSAAMS